MTDASIPSTTIRIGKVFYRLIQGSTWWCGERKSKVGWQTDQWIGKAKELTLPEAWAKFQEWATADAKRIAQDNAE